jgi:hypothetical protein
MIVVVHIGVFIYASETSYIYIQIKQFYVVTTFIDMKFGLLLFLLFILSIISSIIADGLFRHTLFNNDDTLQKLRQKTSNSKYDI